MSDDPVERMCNECDYRAPTDPHFHLCWRKKGHYDDHICECGYDWAPGNDAMTLTKHHLRGEDIRRAH